MSTTRKVTGKNILKALEKKQKKETVKGNNYNLVSDKQRLEAFEMIHLGNTVGEVAAHFGVHYNTIINWKKSDWWTKLSDELFKAAQNDVKMELARHAKTIASGGIGVSAGLDNNDKTASAKVQMVKVFSEMGSDPLIKKPGTQVNVNTQNNILASETLDFTKAREMTQEEALEFYSTGKAPDRLKVINKEE